MKALEGRSGKKSSKRIAGFYLIGLGSGILTASAIVTLCRFGLDASAAIAAGQYMVGVGAGLLIGGLFEGFGIKVGENG